MKSVPEPPQSVSIVRCEPTPKGLALTALALALAWLTLQLAPVVLVLVLMLVGTLNPAVERLEKKKWKTGLVDRLRICRPGGDGAGFDALTIPALIAQIAALVKHEPELRNTWLLCCLDRRDRAIGTLAARIHYAALAKSSAGVAIGYSTKTAEIVTYLARAVFFGPLHDDRS